MAILVFTHRCNIKIANEKKIKYQTEGYEVTTRAVEISDQQHRIDDQQIRCYQQHQIMNKQQHPIMQSTTSRENKAIGATAEMNMY